MITKKDYNNKQAIADDKENFIDFAVNSGFYFEDVLDFMNYYQNLNSFEDNLKDLKERLKGTELKNEKCYLCEKIKTGIYEDVGGLINEDNKVFICLTCFISDKIRRYEEKELSLFELKNEILNIFGGGLK